MSGPELAEPLALSPAGRQEGIRRLTSQVLDVLVVGGGVVGAGTALDAVSRGLSTGLVEAQDWGAGTSSRSSKLIHGGLRYLQMMDFGLVREALRERGLLLRLAPHLVCPLPTMYPLRRPILERAYVGAGIALYDALALTSRSPRRLPLHRHLTRKGALALAPGLRPGSLRGAVLYYDAQVDDARYVVELVRTGAALGAVPVSRMKVTAFLRQGERVTGARLTDQETGAEHIVQARSIVLATGVWTEETEALAGNDRSTRVRPSKGVHLVVPKSCIASSAALILRTEKSVLFVLPWGEHWVIGTTDTDWSHDRGRPLATADDVAYILSELNTILDKPLSVDDIEATYAGLRPLVAGMGVVRGPGEGTTTLSREHAVSRAAPGLVVVSGGKYTTYRVMAKDAVDAVVAEDLTSAPASVTDDIPLIGAEGFTARWAQRRRLAEEPALPLAVVEHLLRRYGGRAQDLLAAVSTDPGLGAPIAGAPAYIRAEAVYAVTHEGARHVDDVLSRRTRAAMELRDGGAAAAQEVAELMAPLLGWDDATKAAEVEDYRRQVALAKKVLGLQGDDRAAEVAAAIPTLMPLP